MLLSFCSYEIKEPSDGMYGSLQKNGSWSGIIGELIRKVNYNTVYHTFEYFTTFLMRGWGEVKISIRNFLCRYSSTISPVFHLSHGKKRHKILRDLSLQILVFLS